MRRFWTRGSELWDRWVPAIALVTLCATAVTFADSWPRAVTREVFSENREWFVRVVPGSSLGDTFGFAGSPKGPYATAEFYRRRADRGYELTKEITLVNPVAPVDFYVTDRGYLVTLDNWHNRGYGQVLALYDPSGATLASYALADFFTAAEIEAFPHSASSIQWHKSHAYVRSDQRSYYMTLDDNGRALIADTDTGAWRLCEHRSGIYQCRTTNLKRVWRVIQEP